MQLPAKLSPGGHMVLLAAPTQAHPRPAQPAQRGAQPQRPAREARAWLQMGHWYYFHMACMKSMPDLLARKGAKMQQLLEYHDQRQLLELAHVARI